MSEADEVCVPLPRLDWQEHLPAYTKSYGIATSGIFLFLNCGLKPQLALPTELTKA